MYYKPAIFSINTENFILAARAKCNRSCLQRNSKEFIGLCMTFSGSYSPQML